MARAPTLVVNVNTQQFQQFATQFTQFSGQIRALNGQFRQINASIQQSNIFVGAFQEAVRTSNRLMEISSNLATRIMKKFLSWGTIISGVTALLGAGGSIYGIERLAATIMAKRRQALGLGQDYGRTQAANIFSQGLMGNPAGVMENIRLGQAGAPDQLTALLAMGINPFGSGAAMSPDDIMDKIVGKLPDLLNRAGPGKQLLMAQAYGLDKLGMDPMDLLRLSTEEGRKEYEEKRKLVKQYEKLMEISPKAQKAWTELELQFQAAKAQIESVFGEALAGLLGPLRDLSEGLVNLVKVLMDSPIVQSLLKQLADGIDTFADYLKKLTEGDVSGWFDALSKLQPVWEKTKDLMLEFADILGKVTEGLVSFVNNFEEFKKSPIGKLLFTEIPVPTYTLPQSWTGAGSSILNWLFGATPAAAAELNNAPASSPAKPAIRPGRVPTLPSTPAPAPAPAPAATPAPVPVVTPPHTPTPIFTGGKPAPLSDSDFNARFGGQQSSISTKDSWSTAAADRVPQTKQMSDATNYQDPNTKQAMNQPLSSNNWQMSRTANLVIRNVPGSNIFMTAAGMTG